MADPVLRFYNTLSRKKDKLEPLDPGHVRLYVCGPTVYDRIHIGNARPLVVFDVLVRLLRYHFPRVTYVRNITDIDDKINARAAESGVSIDELATGTIAQLHEDCRALKVLPPDHEPRATRHIADMIAMIGLLIEKGHAYVASEHVLFDVGSWSGYGRLSRLDQEALRAGARVEVAPYKRSPTDFVLWKPSLEGEPAWDSPWSRGRPGWHIECSAMSHHYLGEVFDIHGGGLDLIFPHHENEMGQSCAAHGVENMAGIWMHNGYVTAGGEKMSKSLGNFVTVEQALAQARGEVVRHALLQAHYRGPLDFSMQTLAGSEAALASLYRAAGDEPVDMNSPPDTEFLEALADDLNTPEALARLHGLSHAANKGDESARASLRRSAAMLGLLNEPASAWMRHRAALDDAALDDAAIDRMIAMRDTARAARDFARADAIRDELAGQGIVLEDAAGGTIWRRG